MQITDILNQLGGIPSIAKELGINENQAASGAAALMPAILGGLKKQSQSNGIEGIGSLLSKFGGANLLDDVLSSKPTDVSKGNDILGQIFGSKDVSRAVAQSASTKAGVDSSVLKKMLPMLTMLVTGYMSKQTAPEAGNGGMLSGLVSGLFGNKEAGSKNAATGLASLIDMDGDGNPLDDILRFMGKA
jgi:hypothetical protein